MSGLMWKLWFISCSLGILFCCSISLLQAPPTVVVAGLQPSFPDVVQYYARRFLQESSPPPSSFLSPTPAPSVFAPAPPPPPPPTPAPSASPPAPTPVNPPSLSLPLSPTPSPTPSPSSIPPPSSSPAPSTTSPVSAPAGNPPQFAPSLPVSLPSLSSPSSSFASPTPSSSPSPLSTTPSSTPLSPPPTSLPPSPSPASSSPSSPPLSLSPPSPPPSPSPSLSPPSPPPSSTPPSSPPIAPPPSFLSPPSSPPIAPPPSFLSPPSASPSTSLPPTPTVPSTTPTSPPQNSPPPATPPPTSPTNSPTSPSSPPSPPPPPPPPSNNVVPSPSSVLTPSPSLSPSPSVVSPSSPPFSSSLSPPPPPPNNPPPVPPPSPTPAPVSSPPTSPAAPSTPPALVPSSLVSPSSPVILSPPPQSSPLTSPSPSAGCCSANTIPRPGSSNASSSCDCVNAITVELQFDNALSNATTSLFQQELAPQLNVTNAQVQVNFSGSTGSRLGLQFASQSPLIVTASMGPLTGSSFPQNLSLEIRTAIVSHEVVFSSTFGNYTLLSLYPPLGNVSTPAPSTVNAASNNSKLGLIIGVAAGGGVILIILAVIVWICCCSKRRADPESATRGPITTRVTAVLDPEVVTPNEQTILADSKSFPRPENTQQFSYEELREATNDFAPEYFLGEGGFGKVYRGVLRDGTEVAIKKLTIGGHQGDKEFLVEVEMLSRLHHRHLVKLLGYFCSHEPRQQLLCYELIPNGSLEAWLHGSLGVTRGPLDWATRMKIAIGAARGLAYLHEDSQPCVIHRDFKASNILLQNNFNPKVADFGLARLAPEGQGNYVSTRVMGTFGYVAPEYAMTGHLLVKSDVYSYGVVLLELLSGRKPVDLSRSEGGENITTWASPMLSDRGRVFELADVRLEGKYPREDFVKVAALAAACIAREWRMRPTMGEVVQTLTAVCRSLEYDLSSDGDRGVNSAGEREGGGASTPTSSTSGGSHLGFSAQWHPTAHASTNLGSEDGSSSLFSSGTFMGTPPEPLSDHLSRTHIIPEDLHEGR